MVPEQFAHFAPSDLSGILASIFTMIGGADRPPPRFYGVDKRLLCGEGGSTYNVDGLTMPRE